MRISVFLMTYSHYIILFINCLSLVLSISLEIKITTEEFTSHFENFYEKETYGHYIETPEYYIEHLTPDQDLHIYCSNNQVNGIPVEDPGRIEAVGQCTHDTWRRLMPTQHQIQNNQVPLCDFNPDPQTGERHPTTTSINVSYKNCHQCSAHACIPCTAGSNLNPDRNR